MVLLLDTARPLSRAVAGVALALVVCFGAGACSDCRSSTGDSHSPDRAPPWPLDSPVAAPIPEAAQAVLFVRRFDDLERGLEFALDRFPTEGAGSTLSVVAILHDLVRPEPLGISPETDVAAFYQGGDVGFVVPLAAPEKFSDEVTSLIDDENLRGRKLGASGIREIQFGDSSTVLQFAVRGDFVFARTAPANPPSGPSGAVDRGAAFRAFFGDRRPGSPRQWPHSEATRDLVAAVASDRESPRAIGYADPGPWLEQLPAEGQAATIRTRLARQIGPTGFHIALDPTRNQLRIDLRNRSVSGEPTVVADMGEASGERPPLGGLVEPGVLGVLRFAVGPERVYRALESTLPAERREQLEVFWGRARRQLLVDGPEAILEHFTGHAAVVLYGLAAERLGESNLEGLRSIFELRATREVVLLQIESRDEVERLLDKLTQITRGRLSRQRSEHTVQYIWLEEGSLEWALLLGDEYVMFVDSATALQKATRYERVGRPLTDREVETMRIGPLLEGRQRSGLFLDTGILAGLLREHGRERTADFLVPFRSLVVTTEQLEGANRTRLQLHLEDP